MPDLNELLEEAEEAYSLASALMARVAIDGGEEASTNFDYDVLIEGCFVGFYAKFERISEEIILHYVCGGRSINGKQPESLFSTRDPVSVRKFISNSVKTGWANQSRIRESARLMLRHGWPIHSIWISISQALSDCTKIRNRIAHDSLNSKKEYDDVLRNIFTTNRLFEMRPGQLLRIRLFGWAEILGSKYTKAMIEAIRLSASPEDEMPN